MSDDFDLDDIDQSEDIQKTNKEKFYNVLAYIPFLNLFLLFTNWEKIKNENKKYFTQWIAIFLLYIVWFILLWFLSFKISFILTLFYFLWVLFFATKAYNDIYVEIGLLEKVISVFQKKIEENKKENNNNNDPLN